MRKMITLESEIKSIDHLKHPKKAKGQIIKNNQLIRNKMY